MNRLQKKCLFAVAGMHFLLVVIVFCSGFIKPKEKVDDSQILDMIPAKAIDAAFSSGVREATPPPPAPPTPMPPQPPQNEPPKVVTPMEPPKPIEPVKPVEPVQPDPKPDESEPPKPKQPPHKVEVNLTPIVHKTTTDADNSEAQAKAAAKRAQAERARAIAKALHNIQRNATTSTAVDLPGDGQVSYANYASIVKSVYLQAWEPPSGSASDSASVTASVTIASDGRVVDAHIVHGSGDAAVDRSVQSTLDRVTQIAPFPDGSKDKERTYPIRFDADAKRAF